MFIYILYIKIIIVKNYILVGSYLKIYYLCIMNMKRYLKDDYGPASQRWYENGQKYSDLWYLNGRKIYTREDWINELKKIKSSYYEEQKMLYAENYNI